MTILAIDPSLRCTGWLVASLPHLDLVACGTIKTRKASKKERILVASDNVRCCGEICGTLETQVREYKVRALVVELPPGGAKGAAAARAMALVTGVIAAFVWHSGLPVEWVSPGDAKKAFTGNRNASKKTVQQYAMDVYPVLALRVYSKKDLEAVCDAAAVLVAADKMGQMIKTLRAAAR